MKRPPYLKHIVAIMAIFGLLFLPLGFLANLFSYGEGGNPLFLALALLNLALLGALLLSAYGLWRMRRWARKAAVGAMVAVILAGLPGLLALLIFLRSIRRLLSQEARAAFEEQGKRGGR
ncbi:MAG: hypothetical protein QW356_05915 [Candidatus Hadarchaeales archaeon]